jgi:hypothetical protein
MTCGPGGRIFRWALEWNAAIRGMLELLGRACGVERIEMGRKVWIGILVDSSCLELADSRFFLRIVVLAIDAILGAV